MKLIIYGLAQRLYEYNISPSLPYLLQWECSNNIYYTVKTKDNDRIMSFFSYFHIYVILSFLPTPVGIGEVVLILNNDNSYDYNNNTNIKD